MFDWNKVLKAKELHIALMLVFMACIAIFVPNSNVSLIVNGMLGFLLFIRNIGFFMWLIGYAERKVEKDPTQTSASVATDGQQWVVTYILTADPLMFLFVYAPVFAFGFMALSPLVQFYRNDPNWFYYFASWPVFALVGYLCWYMFTSWTKYSDPNWLGVRKFLWTSYFKGCRVFEIPHLMDLIFIPSTGFDANSSHDKRSTEALISLMQQAPLTPPVAGVPPVTQSGRQFALLNLQFGLDVFNQPALVTVLYLDYFREDKEKRRHKFATIQPQRTIENEVFEAGPLNKRVLQIGLQRADAVLSPEITNDARNKFKEMNEKLNPSLESALAATGFKLYQATLGDLDDVDENGFFHQQEKLGHDLRVQESKQLVAVAQAEARIEAAKQNERAVKEEMRVRGVIAEEQKKAIDKEIAVATSTAERDIQTLVRRLKEMDEKGREAVLAARLTEMSSEQITQFYVTAAQAAGLNVPNGGNVTLVNAAADAAGLPPNALLQTLLSLFKKP